jgi:hypothetical protein
MRGTFIIGAAAILLLTTGLLHGYIANRWGSSAPLQQAIERLDQLPRTVGEWDGTITKRDVEIKTIRNSGAFVLARYVNRRTGEIVDVSLICGRPGTLSLHPPTICFPAHGYQEKKGAIKSEFPAEKSTPKSAWMVADFVRPILAGEERIHILWCYGVDGEWIAPDNPRISLAGRQAVYKLYLSRVGVGEEFQAQKDPSIAFMKVLLPELSNALFAQ